MGVVVTGSILAFALLRIGRGNLGWSPSNSEPVAQAIRERLPATIEVWFVALVAVIVLGAAGGVVRARLRSTPLGEVLFALGLLARALPVFLVGLVLQMTAIVGWLPANGSVILPVLVLVVPFGAWSARLFRGDVRTAVAMTVSLIGPALLAATLIAEGLSAWRGMSRLFTFRQSDYGLVAGVILTYVIAVAAMKLVGELLLGPNDRAPRGRSSSQRSSATDDSRPFFASWVAVSGLVICAILGVIALSANLIAPWNPYYIDQAHWQGYPLAPGVAGHLLGTDENGRDLLSRLIFAVRNSFGIAIFAALVATAIGLAIAHGAKRLPWFEDGAALAVTGIRSFAAYPLVVTVAAIVIVTAGWKALSPLVVVLIIAAASWPAIVTAARSERSPRYVFATAISVAAGALLLETTMSLDGVGIRPPTPSLGNMFLNALSNLAVAPWVVIASSATLIAALSALNAVGDRLRDSR